MKLIPRVKLNAKSNHKSHRRVAHFLNPSKRRGKSDFKGELDLVQKFLEAKKGKYGVSVTDKSESRAN